MSTPAGECVLDWKYTQLWAAFGSNASWVAQVSFLPAMPNFWVDLASGPGWTGGRVKIHGEPDGLYELQVSTNLSNWAPLARVVMDLGYGGFAADVDDTAAEGGAAFYRARQLP